MFKINKQQVNLSDVPFVPLDWAATPNFPAKQNTNETSSDDAELVCVQEEPELPSPEEQARQLLDEARTEAHLMLERAEEELDMLRKQAHAEGYGAGKAEALRAQEQQLIDGAAAISDLLQQIAQQREALFEQFEGETVDLALAVSEKVIHTALERESGVYEGMIRHALSQMKRAGKITLRVSPEQYERFFSAGSASFVLRDELVRTTVEPDASLLNSDIILEADGETVNAGAGTQLKTLTLAFGRDGGGELS